jgi:uncharacterized protein (TIGR02268 family)
LLRFALVPVLLLLGLSPAARASAPAREKRSTRISLADSPTRTPELRVAPGTATLVHFVDADIDRSEVKLEGRDSRVSLVDVGDHSLMLEPLLELGPEERLVLVVRFTDGRLPDRVAFTLVADEAVVDERVSVSRKARGAEMCQVELEEVRAACAARDAELAALKARSAANGPAALFMDGVLDERGLRPGDIRVSNGSDARGVTAIEGNLLSATSWVLVALKVLNTGKEDWTPAEARLTSAAGERLQVITLLTKPGVVPAGGSGLLVLQVKRSSQSNGTTFRLEVRDGAGAWQLLIPDVMF